MSAWRKSKPARTFCITLRAGGKLRKMIVALMFAAFIYGMCSDSWRGWAVSRVAEAFKSSAESEPSLLDSAKDKKETSLAPPEVKRAEHAVPSPAPPPALRKEPEKAHEPASVEETPATEDDTDGTVGVPDGFDVDEVSTAAPTVPPSKPGKPAWIFCALQWQECWCKGTVRWGNGDKWHLVHPKNEGEDVRVKCSVDKLPDILPGDGSKHCECQVTPGTSFYDSLNPALLAELGDGASPDLATSCEQLQAGAKDGQWGEQQWDAVEGYCSETWGASDKAKDAKAGSRSFDMPTLQKLMRTWIDPRFLGNYKRFFDKTGWAERGFLNYYAGAPGGKHTQMTEELIVSVHEFSVAPIIVFHFGFATPTDWTAKRFPRLVLLHAAPLPSDAGRSFNFNKMRAMLLARLKVGIQLDSDQFVAPGVDAMFKTTQREITQDYPMPILPAHFLDRTPRDTGAYWLRYCPKDKCKYQSARWGHAHPTWTYWALPWLGRWLRRNFRDEVLPAKHGGDMAALRVINVPEDEDLLNIATWEEGGTKQWCKLDLPGPGDFASLFATKKGNPNCKSMCGDITSDSRYHPLGVAKVFYTAHHAVIPSETRKYVARLKEHRESLPPPIMFKGKFYKDGDELKKDHPKSTCII